MKKALIEGAGELISVGALIHRYGKNFSGRGIRLVCPACSQPVFPYGAFSILVLKRFHHFEGADCVLSHKESRWIKTSDWDFERGRQLRAFFSEGDGLKQLYAFFKELCGRKRHLSVKAVCQIIKEADRINLWSYKGVEVWTIPFLLLCLRDFEGYGKASKETFLFRFVLKGRPPKKLKKVWENEKFHLLRVFDGGRVMDFPLGNPYPIRKDVWEQYSKEFCWLNDERWHNLLRSLEKCFEK